MGISIEGLLSDLSGGLIDFGMQSELQEDAQAFSAQQFERQKEHEKDMFGLESGFSEKMATSAYDRQRTLLMDSPELQMQGLKKAGLNPILAATGGFKSPAGGSMPIASARAASGGSGSSAGMGHVGKVQLGQAKLLYEQAKLTSAQKAKTDAETTRIQSEQPKKDFFQFFWQTFNGSIQRFDEAWQQWSKRNREWLNNWMSENGLTIESIKQDFKKYVIDAPPGKNPVSGGHGRKQRRGK